MIYEYKVVPAPQRGIRAKGAKTVEERFAFALQTAMNDLAAEGWEYLRTDTLPCEKREGLMSKTTVFQNMLVFRREKPASPMLLKNEPPLSASPPVLPAASTEKTTKSGPEDDTPPEPPAEKVTGEKPSGVAAA